MNKGKAKERDRKGGERGIQGQEEKAWRIAMARFIWGREACKAGRDYARTFILTLMLRFTETLGASCDWTLAGKASLWSGARSEAMPLADMLRRSGLEIDNSKCRRRGT